MSTYQLLKETYLFHSFSDVALKEILKSSMEVKIAKDTVILQENEISDLFYIILSGDVVVYCLQENKQKIYLARLSRGQYFGEQALLTDSLKPRNASVMATSDCKLLTLKREQLHYIFTLNTSLRSHLDERGRKQALEKILAQHQLLQTLPADTLFKLAGEIIHFNKNSFLFHEGEIANYAYFIVKGEVLINFLDEYDVPRTLIVEAGNFLGELAILHNQPRKANAKANTELSVLRFPKENFLAFYQTDENLQKLLTKMSYVYSIPARGTVTQHIGTYQGLDAMSFVFNLENGKKAIAWHVLQEPYFILTRLGVESQKFYEYHNEHLIVQLSVINNQISSIVCTGLWNDLATACLYLFEEKTLNENDLVRFKESGILKQAEDISETEDKIICYCMKIKENTLIKHIHSGVKTVEELCRLTGAGNICRVCKPNIHSLFASPSWITAYIDEVVEENDSVVSYIIKPLRGKLLPFKAGQHIVVQIPYYGHNVQRTYTLTSSPHDTSCYQITVRSEENGLVSNWLKIQSERKIILQISPPQGNFLLNPKQTNPVLFFAGGIGITPALSFLKHITESEIATYFYLDYSVQSEKDFVQKPFLEKLHSKFPNIEINYRVAKRYGIITPDEIHNILEKYPSADVYFCGPNGFREMLVKALHDNAFDMANHFHLEIFAGINEE